MDKPRRSKLDMEADVLKAIAGGRTKPTRIMYEANLSWQPLLRIMGKLVNGGLVTVIPTPGRPDKRSRRKYELTDDGHRFLIRYDELNRLMEM